MSKVNSVRNPDGIWINSQVFRESALEFKKTGRYCSDPEGSPDWLSFWKEERRRFIHGHTVGGVKITGEHYTYLNYCPIRKAEDSNSKVTKKITDFPDFWDGDFNYFWVREIARKGILEPSNIGEEEKEAILELDSVDQAFKLKELFESLHLEVRIKTDYLRGGWNLIVGKSRRKGYSYKNAACAINNYLARPETLTILGAYEKKYLYPKGIFTMALSYLNFISKHTPFNYPRDFIDRPGSGHIRASTKTYKNGVAIEEGFMSEIMAVSFKDDPDSIRGKDGYDIIIDESGAFGSPGLLKNTLVAMDDVVKDGDLKTGMITVFGTSGDMEKGTADYSEMFNKPAAHGFLPFDNIWDEDSEDFECGFFHPIQSNMPGYYDSQGNSDTQAALDVEKRERKFLVSKGATTTDIQKRMQEKPTSPQEAFGFVSFNNFPVLEIKKRLDIVIAKNIQQIEGVPVELTYSNDTGVEAKPILDSSANPIYKYKPDNLSLEGCPVIYEFPMQDPPKNAYKIGYDPYRQDKGTSLACVYVYKPKIKGEYKSMEIVAEYIGRPSEADDVTYIAKLFALLYNCQIMYENEVTHVKDYFRKKKELHFLAGQPDDVISKHIKKSTVSRVYGCHMNDKMKDAGEKYIKTWLTTVIDYDENDNAIRVLDRINSIGLLEELIKYNRKGNFDRIMALMQVMFQDEQDMEDTVYKNKSSSEDKMKQLVSMQKELYNKKHSNSLAGRF